jgi:hypothetical protein
MAQAPEFRRVSREQLPDERFDGIEPLLYAFNTLAEQTVSALTSNLTVGANILGEISKITINTPVGYGPGVFNTVRVPWPFTTQAPRIVIVGNCTPAPIGSTTVSWTYTYGVITVQFITGLQPNKKYDINLLVL